MVFNEADVFLEMRKEDVADAAQRNALVAIFLKHLEYFRFVNRCDLTYGALTVNQWNRVFDDESGRRL